MRNLVSSAALAAVLLAAACGGGGGSAPSAPPSLPTPTPSPSPVVQYVLRWVGATHSTAQGSVRRALATALTGEPIELAIDAGPGSQIRASGATNGIVQIAASVNGSPVPVPSPVSVVVGNTGVAQSSPLPAPSPVGSPSPAPLNVAAVSSSSTVGSTSIVVTMPDGSTPTDSITVSPALTLACPPLATDSHEAMKASGAAYVGAAGAGDADVYITGPKCADQSTTATTIHFPFGFKRVAAGTPFGSVVTALPFVADGTALTLYDAFTNVGTTSGIFVFGVHGGSYGKARIAAIGCAFVGSAVTTDCNGGGEFAGPAEVGPGGVFVR